MIRLTEILSEVSYDGNMGFHEMYLFYGKATDSQIDKLERLIKDKKFRDAWKLVQSVVGVKLKGKEFESITNEDRDYKKEYEDYHGKPEQKKRRAGRNNARRKMEKLGHKRKGDGKDVHHRNGDTWDNSSKNITVMSASKNRSIKEVQNNIEGGLSNGMSLTDIANKHKVDIDELNTEFKMGVKVEMEHTTDSNIAAEIARDHLFEDPKYYSKLKKIEEDLKKWFGKGKWGGKGGGGWDRYSTTGEVLGKCGDAKEGEPYSACLSKEAASKLGKKGIASFVRRKRDAQKKGGDAKKGGEETDGDKPIRVSWDTKGKKKFNPPK